MVTLFGHGKYTKTVSVTVKFSGEYVHEQFQSEDLNWPKNQFG